MPATTDEDESWKRRSQEVGGLSFINTLHKDQLSKEVGGIRAGLD